MIAMRSEEDTERTGFRTTLVPTGYPLDRTSPWRNWNRCIGTGGDEPDGYIRTGAALGDGIVT